MKIKVIGINFEKYNMLKTIEKFCVDQGHEIEQVSFLNKSAIDLQSLGNCDMIIYVEVQPLTENIPGVYIDAFTDGRTFAADFRRTLKACIAEKKVTEAAKEEPPWVEEKQAVEIDNDRMVCEEAPVVCGIAVQIKGKTIFLKKEDFALYLELKNLTENLGYTIEDVITK